MPSIFMRTYFYSLLLSTSLLLPLTLNSADIFVSSEGTVKIEANLNQHIMPGDSKLGSSIFIISATADKPLVGLDIPCEHTEEILYTGSGKNLGHIFVIRVNFSGTCDALMLRASAEERVFTDTAIPLSLTHESEIMRDLADYGTHDLTVLMRNDFINTQTLESRIQSFSGKTLLSKLLHIRDLYQQAYSMKRSDLARTVLNDRENIIPYISPVAWFQLPTQEVRIPGANRWYRKDTTDGVHHWWDIMAPYGTPVRALAKGIVVRVISDWKWKDFDQIKKTDLSDDDRLGNLNIYRGNQIWLKTMDGNVVFYSHLSRIDPTITLGSIVDIWTQLGAIGTSGVPDKNYKNTHLHFEIQKNPQIPNASIDYLNIMQWDYIGKKESRNGVRAETKELFQ